MNLTDLKNNLIDINIELKGLIETNQNMKYDKSTGFILSSKTNEWKMMKKGFKKIRVHPLFYSEICPHVVDAICELNDIFQKNLHDSELINIYLIFKNNLFLIAKKLMDIDKAEEDKGLYYLTYEQMINTTKFHYFHLYCLYFDVYTLCMLDADREQYLLTLDQFEYIKERSILIKSMLIEANEVAEIKISISLLDLLEEDDTIEKYRKILNMQTFMPEKSHTKHSA
jgi:hypothetical protein